MNDTNDTNEVKAPAVEPETPEISENVSETPEAVPQTPEVSEAVTETPEEIPQTPETVQEAPESVTEISETIPQTPESIPEAPEEIPQAEAVTKTAESVTETPESVSEPPESVPEASETVSEPPEEILEAPQESKPVSDPVTQYRIDELTAPHAPSSAGRAEQKERRKSKPDSPNGKPVVVYILLLFTAALLLMGLSSIMHQRNNLELLGKLENSVSSMREVQDFQEQIIQLQKARQESEDQLKEAQRNLATVVSQTQEDRNRSEALQYLYLIQMEYQMEHYQSCQLLIQEVESRELQNSLPTETIGTSLAAGVVSPQERYYQIREANAARIAEGLPPQTVEELPEAPVPEEWAQREWPEESAPETPEGIPPETPEESAPEVPEGIPLESPEESAPEVPEEMPQESPDGIPQGFMREAFETVVALPSETPEITGG